MSFYKPAITKTADGDFYTLIVRVDKDGEESVIHGYNGRHLKTFKAAERSANKYIAKYNLND